MADAFKQGVVLSKEDGSMVTYFQNAIKRYQSDGVSARTKAALARDLPEEFGPKGLVDPNLGNDSPALDPYGHGTPRRQGATIRLDDGRYITPLEYQKLQQMLLNRRY